MINLTDQERDKFSMYCKQEAENAAGVYRGLSCCARGAKRSVPMDTAKQRARVEGLRVRNARVPEYMRHSAHDDAIELCTIATDALDECERLKSDLFTYCFYCGERFDVDPLEVEPHIEVCPNHPLAMARTENQRLQRRLNDAEEIIKDALQEDNGWVRFRTLEAELDRLRKVERAAKMLLKRIDDVCESPEYRGVWTYLKAHANEYHGPTYEAELAALRAALGKDG